MLTQKLMNRTIIRTTNRLKFEFKAHPNATCNIQYIYIFKKKKERKIIYETQLKL